MCGICGTYQFSGREDDSGVVRAMADSLARRGPDASGVVRAGAATLGHRRLAILDLSSAGTQPMTSRCGRYLISFNGEIYNYRDLRKEIGLDPSCLRSSTDTEILLHAWARWGAGALPRFVGPWAFALFDREENRLWLARDRFGEKPLFFHESAARVTFSSSITSLLRAPWVSREIDQEALTEYISLRYVVAPRTIIAGIRKLPGGCLMSIDGAGTRIKTWFDFPFSCTGERSKPWQGDPEERFDELLRQASRRCLESDVPVALFLSNGIDSGSLRYALRKSGKDIPCYTFVSAEQTSPPMTLEKGDADSTQVVVSPRDLADDLEPAFSSLNEPVGDGVAVATWRLVRAARPFAKVFICGHGGDEVLGGYRLNRDMLRLRAIWRAARIAGFPTIPFETEVNGAENGLHKRERFRDVPQRMSPAAARYLIHRPLPQADFDQIFDGRANPDHRLSALDALYNRCDEQAGDLDRMQYVMLKTFLPENILSFGDATSMDASAELRMPYLDRDLVEFVLGLPADQRSCAWPGRSQNKVLLRRWASHGRLPTETIRRRKQGFESGSIENLLREAGTDVQARILDMAPLKRLMPGLGGWLANSPEFFKRSREGTLWALIALAVWYSALPAPRQAGTPVLAALS